MVLSKKRALYALVESTYGEDPSSGGDGSTFLYIPTLELGMLEDGKAPFDTQYYTARPWPTAPIAGRDGWSFTCTIPVIGMASTPANTFEASSIAADWFDTILLHIFGTLESCETRTLNTGGNTTTLETDVDPSWVVQDMVLSPRSTAPTSVVEWSVITSTSGTTHSIHPTRQTAPNASSAAYGTKMYRYNESGFGGAALSFCYEMGDGDIYLLSGGRCTSATINIVPNDIAKMSLTFSGDSATQDSGNKTALPTPAAPTYPCKGMLSAFHLNDTRYATSEIEIDLGIQSAEVASTQGEEGRGEFENLGMVPTVRVHPQRTDAIRELKRTSGDTGSLMVQIGGGNGGGSGWDTCCLFMPAATVMEVSEEDENGRQRQSVLCRVADEITTYSASSVPVQFARG